MWLSGALWSSHLKAASQKQSTEIQPLESMLPSRAMHDAGARDAALSMSPIDFEPASSRRSTKLSVRKSGRDDLHATIGSTVPSSPLPPSDSTARITAGDVSGVWTPASRNLDSSTPLAATKRRVAPLPAGDLTGEVASPRLSPYAADVLRSSAARDAAPAGATVGDPHGLTPSVTTSRGKQAVSAHLPIRAWSGTSAVPVDQVSESAQAMSPASQTPSQPQLGLPNGRSASSPGVASGGPHRAKAPAVDRSAAAESAPSPVRAQSPRCEAKLAETNALESQPPAKQTVTSAGAASHSLRAHTIVAVSESQAAPTAALSSGHRRHKPSGRSTHASRVDVDGDAALSHVARRPIDEASLALLRRELLGGRGIARFLLLQRPGVLPWAKHDSDEDADADVDSVDDLSSDSESSSGEGNASESRKKKTKEKAVGAGAKGSFNLSAAANDSESKVGATPPAEHDHDAAEKISSLSSEAARPAAAKEAESAGAGPIRRTTTSDSSGSGSSGSSKMGERKENLAQAAITQGGLVWADVGIMAVEGIALLACIGAGLYGRYKYTGLLAGIPLLLCIAASAAAAALHAGSRQRSADWLLRRLYIATEAVYRVSLAEGRRKGRQSLAGVVAQFLGAPLSLQQLEARSSSIFGAHIAGNQDASANGFPSRSRRDGGAGPGPRLIDREAVTSRAGTGIDSSLGDGAALALPGSGPIGATSHQRRRRRSSVDMDLKLAYREFSGKEKSKSQSKSKAESARTGPAKAKGKSKGGRGASDTALSGADDASHEATESDSEDESVSHHDANPLLDEAAERLHDLLQEAAARSRLATWAAFLIGVVGAGGLATALALVPGWLALYDLGVIGVFLVAATCILAQWHVGAVAVWGLAEPQKLLAVALSLVDDYAAQLRDWRRLRRDKGALDVHWALSAHRALRTLLHDLGASLPVKLYLVSVLLISWMYAVSAFALMVLPYPRWTYGWIGMVVAGGAWLVLGLRPLLRLADAVSDRCPALLSNLRADAALALMESEAAPARFYRRLSRLGGTSGCPQLIAHPPHISAGATAEHHPGGKIASSDRHDSGAAAPDSLQNKPTLPAVSWQLDHHDAPVGHLDIEGRPIVDHHDEPQLRQIGHTPAAITHDAMAVGAYRQSSLTAGDVDATAVMTPSDT